MKKICLALYVLLFVGCSSVSLHEVSREYYQGDSKKAFEYTLRGVRDFKDALLYQMMGGVIGFQMAIPKALDLLENAEQGVNANEKRGILRDIFEGMGAMMINDNVMSYKGYLYEGVMINYYKALLYMQRGDLVNARVEFNRANDRQRRIKDYYQSEINQANRAKNKLQSKGFQLDQEERILSSYTNLSKFSSLEGYINPIVSYVSGLFFTLEGDNKGMDLLKEAYAISNNPVIQEDFLMAQEGMEEQTYTWVIIEDGMIASKRERGFSLPIWTQEAILSISLALPDTLKGKEFGKKYELILSEKRVEAKEINVLDELFVNEFSKQLPFVITGSIISATSKTLAQYSMQKSATGISKFWLSLGGMAYGVLSTRADLRSNRILPHSFWVAKIKNAKGTLILSDGKKVYFEMQMSDKCKKEKNELCVGKNNIIYFRNAGKNTFHQIVLEL